MKKVVIYTLDGKWHGFTCQDGQKPFELIEEDGVSWYEFTDPHGAINRVLISNIASITMTHVE